MFGCTIFAAGHASLAAGRGVSLQMIGKLLGHKVPATSEFVILARDAVQAVNDELGAAMQAAINRPRSKVVRLHHGHPGDGDA